MPGDHWCLKFALWQQENHNFAETIVFLLLCCAVVWALFSVLLIFCITSFGDCTCPKHQETTVKSWAPYISVVQNNDLSSIFLFLEHSLGIATFHTIKWHGTYPLIMVLLQIHDDSFRVQRKSVLQFAVQASCSYHVLAQKSFQLAPTKLLTCRIGLIAVHFPQNFTCPPGKLSTECTSTIEKSTSPGLSNTTFFACWPFVLTLPYPKRYSATL